MRAGLEAYALRHAVSFHIAGLRVVAKAATASATVISALDAGAIRYTDVGDRICLQVAGRSGKVVGPFPAFFSLEPATQAREEQHCHRPE